MLNTAAVNYIGHSGFLVDFDGNAVIIDYYKRKFNEKWSIPLPKDPQKYRSITVLVSHKHSDHFNPKIFSWRQERPNIAYVISSDAREQVAAALESLERKGTSAEGTPNITFLERGEKVTVNGHEIGAFGSTDEGISFHIYSNNMSVFHAGDFNYWHWSEESTEEAVREAREAFDKELSLIREEICDLDIAFFPVDPRMGADFYRGAVLFCEEMTPSWLIPMHFPEEFEIPCAFEKEIETVTTYFKLAIEKEPTVFERDPSCDNYLENACDDEDDD